MEPAAGIPIRRRRVSLDNRRLSRLWPNDAEPRPIRQHAYPIQAVCGDDDDRSPDRSAKSRIGPDPRRFRQYWLGVRPGGRHATRASRGTGRQLWLGWRLGHLLALGPERGHGRNHLDAGLLDVTGAAAGNPRFLDNGLSGDRRLKLPTERIASTFFS